MFLPESVSVFGLPKKIVGHSEVYTKIRFHPKRILIPCRIGWPVRQSGSELHSHLHGKALQPRHLVLDQCPKIEELISRAGDMPWKYDSTVHNFLIFTIAKDNSFTRCVVIFCVLIVQYILFCGKQPKLKKRLYALYEFPVNI